MPDRTDAGPRALGPLAQNYSNASATPEVGEVRCTLVVPCYNEARSIGGCLDALYAAPLPIGARWHAWIVVDDASTDATAAEVGRWQRSHPEVTVDLRQHPARQGKAAALEAVRAELAKNEDGQVMVICDADGLVSLDALTLLVAPFVEDPTMAVTWGWSTPRGPSRRRRASRFQAVVSEEQARRSPPGACPAFGRLFALRPGAITGFAWHPGFVNDDTPLAEHVRRVDAPHRLVAQATIAVMPAAGFRDFYLQTYRWYASRAIVQRSGPSAQIEAHRPCIDEARPTSREARLMTLRALGGAVRREPAGLPAYLLARVVAAVIHRARPAPFADAWEISASTK